MGTYRTLCYKSCDKFLCLLLHSIKQELETAKKESPDGTFMAVAYWTPSHNPPLHKPGPQRFPAR